MAKTKKVKPLQGESEDIQNTIKEAVEKEEVLSDVKMNKKIDANPIKVKTPYPKEHKKTNKIKDDYNEYSMTHTAHRDDNDVNFIGEELVKLSNRLNEIELSVSDISIQLKQVRSRMGLI